MTADGNLSKAQFVYASPQRQTDIRRAVRPLLPDSRSAKTNARNEGVIHALTYSGVPVEDLHGMTGISYQRSGTADAQYRRSEVRNSSPRKVLDASVRLDLPVADALHSGTRDERTKARNNLIHEIGHHVHAEADHDAYFSGAPGRSGHAEALAENYADRHARPYPSVYDQIANAQPGEDAYGNRQRWGATNSAVYLKHRQAGTQPR